MRPFPPRSIRGDQRPHRYSWIARGVASAPWLHDSSRPVLHASRTYWQARVTRSVPAGCRRLARSGLRSLSDLARASRRHTGRFAQVDERERRPATRDTPSCRPASRAIRRSRTSGQRQRWSASPWPRLALTSIRTHARPDGARVPSRLVAPVAPGHCLVATSGVVPGPIAKASVGPAGCTARDLRLCSQLDGVASVDFVSRESRPAHPGGGRDECRRPVRHDEPDDAGVASVVPRAASPLPGETTAK